MNSVKTTENCKLHLLVPKVTFLFFPSLPLTSFSFSLSHSPPPLFLISPSYTASSLCAFLYPPPLPSSSFPSLIFPLFLFFFFQISPVCLHSPSPCSPFLLFFLFIFIFGFIIRSHNFNLINLCLLISYVLFKLFC